MMCPTHCKERFALSFIYFLKNFIKWDSSLSQFHMGGNKIWETWSDLLHGTDLVSRTHVPFPAVLHRLLAALKDTTPAWTALPGWLMMEKPAFSDKFSSSWLQWMLQKGPLRATCITREDTKSKREVSQPRGLQTWYSTFRLLRWICVILIYNLRAA